MCVCACACACACACMCLSPVAMNVCVSSQTSAFLCDCVCTRKPLDWGRQWPFAQTKRFDWWLQADVEIAPGGGWSRCSKSQMWRSTHIRLGVCTNNCAYVRGWKSAQARTCNTAQGACVVCLPPPSFFETRFVSVTPPNMRMHP